jgi:hypothetical protein
MDGGVGAQDLAEVDDLDNFNNLFFNISNEFDQRFAVFRDKI